MKLRFRFPFRSPGFGILALALFILALVVTEAPKGIPYLDPYLEWFRTNDDATSSRILAPHRFDAKPPKTKAGKRNLTTKQEPSEKLATEGLSRVLVLSPKAPTQPDETHAALAVTKTSYRGNISFRGRVKTVRQLRIGSPPNPWECLWVVWNYQNDNQFYYVAIKPNGWELGKGDPNYPGGQRFLRTGERPFPIGVWHDFEIIQNDNEISVRLNGHEVTSFRDDERPYTRGRLGFYAEDAEIEVDQVTAPFSDDFNSYPVHVHRRDGHAIKNWFMPFLGYGHVAIADRKK